MLSSVEINRIKSSPSEMLKYFKNNNDRDIIELLRKLGKLSKSFDKAPLLFLLEHNKARIRYLAVKNLAKLEDITLLKIYKKILVKEDSAKVRREATSAIGRLRNTRAILVLFKLLNDYDPEVVLQAIRGLLVFKHNKVVRKKLEELKDHPNEIVKEIISSELNSNKKIETDVNHSKSPDFMKNVTVQGDVRDVLKKVPSNSIHLTFTSPPYYNARDYSIYKSYKQYLDFLEEVFKEVHRVTKEGRFFILNTSPIIIPRFSRQHASKRYPIPYDIHCRLIKLGWEFIDDIVWVKPESSVKNRNAGFLQHRKPLAYKPNVCHECVMVYRKKTNKLIDWNIRQYKWNIIQKSKVKGKYETTNIWQIDPVFDKTHSAVFPLELCNRIIKYYSFIGDLVFDPFAGSGTFGKAALMLNRYFFLTEIEPKYVQRIRENLIQRPINSNYYKKPSFLTINEFNPGEVK